MIDIISHGSGSTGNLYEVVNDTTSIILECGLAKDLTLMSLSKPITSYNGCLISHKHGDHSSLIDYIASYTKVYANYGTLHHYRLVNTKNCTLISDVPFKIKDIMIVPISVPHGNVENNAFILLDKNSKVLFATDFITIENNLSGYDFDKIFIECNYSQSVLDSILKSGESDKEMKYIRQLNTHCSDIGLIEILNTFNLSKCTEINLLHLSEFCSNANEMKKLIGGKFNIKVNVIDKHGVIK